MTERWREEGSPARELGTEEQHGGEFPGPYFCLIYPRLRTE